MKKSTQRNILKISLSVVMCLVICIVTMGSVPATTYTAYIDPQLKTVLSTAKATDLIPIDIWLFEIDTDEIDDKVISKTGIGLASVKNEKTAATLTNAQIDNYIETERAVYAEAQAEQSQAFMNKYAGIFNVKSAESNGLFVSKYAPVIRIEVTPTQLATFAKDLSVEAIYYSPELEAVQDSNDSFPTVGATYTRDTLGLTGSGIKIGILENSGLPARGSYNIPTNKIVFDPYVDRTIFSEHATKVASIIMEQYDGTYEGIVPDAYVYATYTCDVEGYERNWRECVEYLIERGVNIINMSMSLYDGLDSNGNKIYTGMYNGADRWADHVALQHHVHIVKSAGNNGAESGYVASPGLAYNVITVGNLDINNSPSLSDDSIYYKSSYKEEHIYELPNKPDIVAPGHDTQTGAGNIGGTSAATPHVTGIVAQLCQADNYLKTNPVAVKAILCASAATDPHSYYPTHSNYDKYGAGLVNAQYAYNTTINDRYVSDYFQAYADEGEFKLHTFTINSAKSRVKIALTWLNYTYINSNYSNEHASETEILSPVFMPDLSISIFDSNNNYVSHSSIQAGNVEIVQLQNLPAGTYTIIVINNAYTTESTHYNVAWWY